MTKKTVNKSKVGKSEDMKATQEDVVRMYGDSMVCEPCCEPDEACCCDDAALRGVISASGMARVGRRQARQGKKYHGERLKLLVGCARSGVCSVSRGIRCLSVMRMP